ADVVPLELDAEVSQRGEVEVEDVRWGRLEDDLILEVMLEAERVLAVAAVARSNHRLDVRGPPRLRPQAAQERRRIHRPRAELGVVRLHENAAPSRPVVLERADHVLVVEAAHSGGQSYCRSITRSDGSPKPTRRYSSWASRVWMSHFRSAHGLPSTISRTSSTPRPRPRCSGST